MINEKYIELVTGHLQGTLSSDEQQTLRNLIKSNEIHLPDLKEMEAIYEQVDAVDVPKPGNHMRDRFYSMLEKEKKSQPKSFSEILAVWSGYLQDRFTPGVVYAIGLFLIGLLIGHAYSSVSTQDEQIEQLTNEIYQMREMMMINLLDNSSPTERLRAVNISTEIRSADNRVIEALLETLNNDPNVNVRIAAVDALLHRASNPAVRSGMIRSISVQESPVVQVALADAMLVLQEKKSVEEFQKLLEKNGLDNSVRNKLENTIVALI